MPRDVNGLMTPVTGNPVLPDTTIESTWANATITDIVNEITASLDRSGKGGMLDTLMLVDGVKTAPGVAFSDAPSTGFYRPSTGVIVVALSATDHVRFTTNGVEVSADGGASWKPYVVSNTAGLTMEVVATLPGTPDADTLYFVTTP